jgi:hypothetical protein
MADVMVTIGGTQVPLQQVLTAAAKSVDDFTSKTVSSSKNAATGVGSIASEGTKLPAVFRQAADSVDNVGKSGSVLGNLFKNIGSTIRGEFDQIKDRAGMVLETMLLWRGIDDIVFGITSRVQDLGQEMFDLNVMMEKNINSWQYLFGGGITGTGTQDAQQLASWAKTASLTMPFTQQDVYGAITALGAKYDKSTIEQYLPMISDLASTLGSSAYGGRGVTLSQAGYEISRASEGYFTSLAREMHISKEDLAKYGYVEGNEDKTLLPALQKYSDTRGITGAGEKTSQTTWWGAWSSFVDRMRNFGLDATNTAFADMKGYLNDISKWMADHQPQLDQLAKTIGGVLSGALKWAGQEFKEFIAGLKGASDGGAMEAIGHAFREIGLALGDPNIKGGIGLIAGLAKDIAGNRIENAAHVIGWIADRIKDIADNEAAMNVLRGTIVMMAVAIGVDTVEALVAAIPLTWAWVTGLDAAAIAMGIIEAPLWVVIGGIGLLAIGIIELVSHWGDISKFLSNIWGGFEGLVGGAYHWGSDMLGNFWKGITDAWNKGWPQFINYLTMLKKHMGFSVPEEGPLKDQDKWGGHFVQNWINSVDKEFPALRRSVDSITENIQYAMPTSNGGSYANNSYSTAYGPSYGNSTSNLSIYAAGEVQIQRMIDQATKGNDARYNSNTRMPGGFARAGGIGF